MGHFIHPPSPSPLNRPCFPYPREDEHDPIPCLTPQPKPPKLPANPSDMALLLHTLNFAANVSSNFLFRKSSKLGGGEIEGRKEAHFVWFPTQRTNAPADLGLLPIASSSSPLLPDVLSNRGRNIASNVGRIHRAHPISITRKQQQQQKQAAN